MKKQEVEKRINTAVDNATPNKLDSVMSACNTQQGNVKIETASNKSKLSGWIKGTSVVAAVLILAICLTFIFTPGSKSSAQTVILLDVNPSFSIAVDEDEKVVSVEAANADAAAVIGEKDYKGKTLDEAVDGIVEGMIEEGYIDEKQNSVLVSVEDDDTARGDKMREKVAERVNKNLKNCNVNGAVLSQSVKSDKKEYKALAKQYDISIGKAALIHELISKDATLSFEDLSKLSVNQIALISDSKQLATDAVKQTGTASDKAYISKDAALEAALTKAGFAKEDIKELEIEFNCKKGVMYYEVEFRKDFIEYEYKINATTGEIIKEEIEDDKKDDDKDDDKDNDKDNDKDDDKDDDKDEKPIIDTSNFIGEAQAQTNALKDLGIEESAVAFIETKIETDDGVPEYYKVKIYTSEAKHVYKIDLTNGTVLAHKVTELNKQQGKPDKDNSDKTNNGVGNGNAGNGNQGGNGNHSGEGYNKGHGGNGDLHACNAIGKTRALEIVFTDAGIAESDAINVKIAYDYDDGKAEYEIEFIYNNTEYEYDIDAVTGEIIEKDIDLD